MIKITAEIHTEYAGHGACRFRLRVSDDQTQTVNERILQPEELYTSSIFNRVFDHMKDQLLRELEKQNRLRNSI